MEISGIFKSSSELLHTRLVNANKINKRVPNITRNATSWGMDMLFFFFGLLFRFRFAI